ncbi:hypothetical protein [Leptospira sarikeiensis]|nr:hypothetical protein [Leptospira sarikeiensis]
MSSDTCSDKDRSCGVEGQILSIFSAPQGIYLYSTQTSYQGDLAKYGSSFEDSLHNICTGNRLFASIINSSCSNVLPLVSTSTHNLSNFPTDYGMPDTSSYPVRGAKGDIIANSWNLFLDENPLITLQAAGVVSQNFWTFSSLGGVYNSADNCIAGTSNSAAGAIGTPDEPTNGWVSSGAPGCSEYHPIICACY